MCASYHISSNFSPFWTRPSFEGLRKYPDTHFLPYNKAPVLVFKDGKYQLQDMSFSLVPSWSKTARVKFATHNARLETIAEKPTWKKPFLSNHCLVPMTSFVEPIYTGEHAGYMVEFFENKNDLLVAAGIFDEWVNTETGEVLESFSIITDRPPAFIEYIGHDRCPLFVGEDFSDKWLKIKNQNSDQLLQLLKANKQEPNFAVKRNRPMRPGWEKRIPIVS